MLILGGNGYLGSKVVRRFLEQGDEVVCTKRKNSDLSRLNDLHERITWIPASLDAIEAVNQYTTFDFFVNMACNYEDCNGYYGSTLEANVEFPLRVFDKLVNCGTMNYLTIGTGLPINFNMYSFSKSIFASFGKFYVEKHGVNFYNLKLEMFYGSDEPRSRFLPSMISKMIKGEVVDTTLGIQKRDIISVEDVVKAIMIIVKSEIRGYNEIPVGTGLSPHISEIVDFLWEETGRKSKVNKGVIPMRQNEPDCVADISILAKLGEWRPIYWKDGMKQMIHDMKKQINGGMLR